MPDAVWFPAPRRVELRREPSAAVGPRGIRVSAIVSGISAGSELLVLRNEVPPELTPDLPTIGGGFGFPVKFGYASVGRVIEAGGEVDRRLLDQVVFVHHPHQDEYVINADAAVPLPDGLAPELGVFAANLETAVTVALDARPRLGEAVLVTGQGVVGLLITLLLRRIGVRPLITIDRYARRREASIAAGAERALDPDEDIEGIVGELTDGRGVDVAIEASGNPSALQSCIGAVAFSGTVVVSSWYGVRQVGLDLGTAFHRRRIRLVSSQVSTLDPELSGRWDRTRRMRLVLEMLCQLPLAPLISHRFAFRDAAEAYRLVDEHPDQCQQVVLTYV